ncbi:MAG: hypothetical protein RL422_228 [Bacteroidota bacterium]|jgi:hypothetical protein
MIHDFMTKLDEVIGHKKLDEIQLIAYFLKRIRYLFFSMESIRVCL